MLNTSRTYCWDHGIRSVALITVMCFGAVLHGQVTEKPAIIGDAKQILDAVDPRQDGWDSEAFTQEVDAVQKQLAKALSAKTQQAKFENFAAKAYMSKSLRPDALNKVFDDKNTTIERGDTGDKNFEGRTGFSKAMENWLSPWNQATSIRMKFKTVGINPSVFGGTSVALYEGMGFHSDRTIQQNATWTIYWKREAEKLEIARIEVSNYEQITVRANGGRLLSDCTEAVLGNNPAYREQLVIGSHDWMSRLDRNISMETFGHQGIAIGDVNGDGRDDVYVCQGAGLPNRLFIQNVDGTASDVSKAAGVDWLEPTRSALILDFDNDGDQDLAITTDADIMLMSNDGKGRFTREALLPLGRPGFSMAAADYDVDGDLDLYVCIYYSPSTDPNALAHPVPYFNATNGGRNFLWRNDISDGKWKFTDVTEKSGLSHNNSRWSFAAIWDDVDNDGDLDLYVANDFGHNNFYQNNDGVFRDVAESAGVTDRSFGMSAAFGDVNRDGMMDLYVSNMFSSAGSRITSQPEFRLKDFDKTRKAFAHLARGNTLFQNIGEGKFKDISEQSATMMGRWSWASQFVDLNNDSWLDLAIANGWLTNELNDDL